MATKRPSYLKRQKEQKRTARAAEKREARKQRKQSKPEDAGEFTGNGEEVEDTEAMIS
jgi:hypothetical protein